MIKDQGEIKALKSQLNKNAKNVELNLAEEKGKVQVELATKKALPNPENQHK